MTTKYLFFTGGVVSSVGKGVTAAATGLILKERGFKVAVQKLDPYINVDPGTMSPYQHGEVFVLDDGAETDLDLGHYERFIDIRLTRVSNFTSGQVYAEIIGKERRGDFLGGTIQVIPHITNEIKRRIGLVAKETGAEIVIVEVGGTVGDIESQPFLEALRQLRNEVGRENVFFIHVTWLPYIGATGELKTKPTQHSVAALRSIGISPNMIIARSDYRIGDGICDKIALFCDVEKQAVVPMVTSDVLYEVPLLLEQVGVGDYCRKARGQSHPATGHEAVEETCGSRPQAEAVGQDCRRGQVCGTAGRLHVRARGAQACRTGKRCGGRDRLGPLGGLGAGQGLGVSQSSRRHCRARRFRVPRHRGQDHSRPIRPREEGALPGLCLGMQVMTVEFARHVLDHEDANSTEFDRSTGAPVIDLMLDQRAITDMGGTMRLGLYPCVLQPGTKAAAAYGVEQVEERHRHRFEFNNAYRTEFEKAGMVFSGISPDGRLVEIAEIEDHPYMVGSQFHPEFLSRPMRPHPLFVGLVEAAKGRHANGKGEA